MASAKAASCVTNEVISDTLLTIIRNIGLEYPPLGVCCL